MSKVIAFMGSPRKEGNSSKLVKQVIAGAELAGAEIIVYNLNEEGIKGCQGCLYCRENEGCATKDKLHPMYEDIKSADGIIASFPIYFIGIGGQSKSWIDRMYPMVNGDFSPRYPGKKAVTVYAQGDPDKDLFKNTIDTTNMLMGMFGWELLDSIHSYGSSDHQYTIPQELMDRAYEAGSQLIK